MMTIAAPTGDGGAGWHKTALNRLGYYTPNPDMGMTDDGIDQDFRDALFAFQRIHVIPFGDLPVASSVTERIIIQELKEQDDDGLYIWRTVGDQKVRGEHAARNGKLYHWNTPPDGEHPGDDYNCRCWAEPVNPPRHPWMDWLRERKEERKKHTETLQKLQPSIFKDIKIHLTQNWRKV